MNTAMKWKDAKTIALSRIKQLPLPPEEQRLDGLTIQLYEYHDAKLLAFEQGITADLDSHRQVLLMMQRELKKRGAKVNVIPVTIDHYLQWGHS